ncbi:hypothetical protein PS3A_55430 [Pseudomonas sp. 3A(2025)]
MNDWIEHFVFVTLAILLYAPSRWAKFALSGQSFTTTKLLAATFYNLIVIVIYMDFIKTSNIPFYGHLDKYILGWLSMAMIWLHASALPMEWQRRPWRLRKVFDPKIRKHKLTFDRYRLEQPRKSILFFWKR